MNIEDLYRQMRYSPNALRSDRRFMKQVAPDMMRAMGQIESTQIGATADIMGNVLRNRGAVDVANIGDTGETYRTGVKESGETLRDELRIAGAKALKQMEESGLYGRQGMAQKYGRSMMDREDFLKQRAFDHSFMKLGAYSEPATGISSEDISSIVDQSFQRNPEIEASIAEKKRRMNQEEDVFDWGLGGKVGRAVKGMAMPYSYGTGGW